MMSNSMDDGNWGERKLAQRMRQRWLIKGTMIALGVVFVVGTRSLVAGSRVTHGTEAMIAAAFVATIAVLGWISWRRNDEIQRRIAINAYAVMGLTCLMLLPLARGVGPLLGVREPMLVAYLIAVVTVPASVAFQRMRG